MSHMVRITAVRVLRVLRERRVEITLTTGETRELDLAPLLRGQAFDGVRADAALFEQVAVDPEFGSLVWPGGADICPDVLIHDRHPA